MKEMIKVKYLFNMNLIKFVKEIEEILIKFINIDNMDEKYI